MSNKTKKKDFVEIKYTGYANGDIFDSNVEEDLKKIDPKATPKKTVVIVGEDMIVRGLDENLEDKEIGKEYKIEFGSDKGFGDRKKELIKTVPLKAFTEKNVRPAPGMVFNVDGALVRIVSVSGGRVLADFNNPLAGKNFEYKFKIERIVTDEKEKVESVFSSLFRMIPQFDIEEKKVIVKGPKGLEGFVTAFKERFKELIGKELEFKEMTKEELDKDLKRMSEEKDN